MNRGVDRGRIFFSDNDRTDFGQRLADIHLELGVRTIAYCLMDNHYHLLMHCPDGGLSKAMQLLSGVFTRHVNDRVGRDGPLFRGRFHSQLITDDAYLLAAVRYIHRNALDLPGVGSSRDYRWSSHRTYLGLRRTPSWLETSLVLDFWNGDADGFDAFVESDGPGPSLRPDRAAIRRMLAASKLVLAEDVVDDHQRTGSLARSMVLVWATERGATEDTLMAELGFDTLNALRSAASRARRRWRADESLRTSGDRARSLADAAARLHLVSDPGCNQRAARAAS